MVTPSLFGSPPAVVFDGVGQYGQTGASITTPDGKERIDMGGNITLFRDKVPDHLLRGGTHISEAPTIPMVAIDPMFNGFTRMIDPSKLNAADYAAAASQVEGGPGTRAEKAVEVLYHLENMQKEATVPVSVPVSANAGGAYKTLMQQPPVTNGHAAAAVQSSPASLQGPTIAVQFELQNGKLRIPASYHAVRRGSSVLVFAWDTRWPGQPMEFGKLDDPIAAEIPAHNMIYLLHTTGITFTDDNRLYIVMMVEREVPIPARA